jgi:hypothetical protein
LQQPVQTAPKSREIKHGINLRWSAALAFIVIAALPGWRPANALPSYARQTGQQCAACHNGFPELTPYGRLFKLNGYTFTGGGDRRRCAGLWPQQ